MPYSGNPISGQNGRISRQSVIKVAGWGIMSCDALITGRHKCLKNDNGKTPLRKMKKFDTFARTFHSGQLPHSSVVLPLSFLIFEVSVSISEAVLFFPILMLKLTNFTTNFLTYYYMSKQRFWKSFLSITDTAVGEQCENKNSDNFPLHYFDYAQFK